MKEKNILCLSRIICNVVIGALILLKLTDAGSVVTHGLRVRREAPTVDVSLKTPVLNALTERTAIDASWEQCMIVAPVTIQLMGQLLIVASTKDVSLLAPDRKFTYIRNPESLRATLLQVAHEGYNAFLSGHSTMNVIQLRMIQIPKHIKTALKILGGNFPRRVLTRLLPQVLGSIEETGKECVTLTNATKNQFTRVMELVQEVIRTTAATQSVHESKVEENEREMAILRSLKADLEKEEKFRAKLYKDATDTADRAEATYSKALNDIPTGMGALLKDFARGILKLANTVAEAGAAVLTGQNGRVGAQLHQAVNPIAMTGNMEGKQPLSFGLSQTLSMATQFANSLRSFQNAFLTNSSDPKLMKGYGIAFKAFHDYITMLPDNPAKAKAIKLIKHSEALAATTTQNAQQLKLSNETNIKVNEELGKICDDLGSFESAYQNIDPKAASHTLSTIGTNTAGDSSQNEILKAQIAQKQLTEMRRRQDEQAAEYLKLLEGMREINAKMISVDLTTISYKEIIALLKEAFTLLTQVETQWHNFVAFFTTMSEYIHDMIKGPLKRFLRVAAVGSNLDLAMRMQIIDILKEDTFGIHREAYILFVMAHTYHEVSSKYLMGRLSSLSGMLIVRNKIEREELMNNLTRQTDQTLKEIKTLIVERKENFDKEFTTRNTELTTLIDKLGGPNEKDQLAIEEGQRLITDDTAWSDK
ncbi:unnamed protein product [Rotaria socialis]|uniref:Uncharacterized protein n=2 Tax=Rotaria socialis TaxID=392032 RepID=A0A817LFG3_9BILA|nr:unnamed protein product [Rotaria socialis]CAF3245059.1 unnamed protein product [Rotaria socialis]CAF3425132.1 unnamed protein product [Rotaria socialis]CAF4104929.1 unnamed protein product [Rotaria socialis]CAF4197092.1 unnamed protein product [Rotaria socialis]